MVMAPCLAGVQVGSGQQDEGKKMQKFGVCDDEERPDDAPAICAAEPVQRTSRPSERLATSNTWYVQHMPPFGNEFGDDPS